MEEVTYNLQVAEFGNRTLPLRILHGCCRYLNMAIDFRVWKRAVGSGQYELLKRLGEESEAREQEQRRKIEERQQKKVEKEEARISILERIVSDSLPLLRSAFRYPDSPVPIDADVAWELYGGLIDWWLGSAATKFDAMEIYERKISHFVTLLCELHRNGGLYDSLRYRIDDGEFGESYINEMHSCLYFANQFFQDLQYIYESVRPDKPIRRRKSQYAFLIALGKERR